MDRVLNWDRSVWLLALSVLICVVAPGVRASDHGDSSVLIALQRHDARLTDLHAFTRGQNLVLALSFDPTAPLGTSYTFPEDLTLRILLDNRSEVLADGLLPFGGTVLEPGDLSSDVTFVITFPKGKPRLTLGEGRVSAKELQFFAGLRDDPFIRTPRHGKNVAAVVIEFPLRDVARRQSTLLIWATSEVPELGGSQADHVGRALRSQFPVTAAKTQEVLDNPLNVLHPADHAVLLGTESDVVIFDTARPADFPNGRELTDDVIRELGMELPGEDPGNHENDVPFLGSFPYLAPPHE